MAKRTPKQVLDAIDAWDDRDADAQIDAHIDAEMERVVAMTPEQVEAELRAPGVDVEAEDAKAHVAYEKMQRGEAPAPPAPAKGTAEPVATSGDRKGKGEPAGVVVPISRARKRVTRWGAGFLIAAAVGGGYAATLGSGVMSSPTQEAAKQRHAAEEACARKDWRACLNALDAADRAVPEGANDPRERELRGAAQAGLGLPGRDKQP
jgi:hypothetical protein